MACADVSRWLIRSLYTPVGAEAVLFFLFFFFAGADWKSPTGIALPHLFLQLIFIPNNLFVSLLFAIASFQFAFEVRTVVFLSRTTFESDSCLHFLFPPLLWAKYVLVRQLWLRAISQTAVVLPEWMLCLPVPGAPDTTLGSRRLCQAAPLPVTFLDAFSPPLSIWIMRALLFKLLVWSLKEKGKEKRLLIPLKGVPRAEARFYRRVR